MIGPYVASVWADPEVGTGRFFIRLEPPPGGEIASDTTVYVGLRPLNNRLAEVRYATQRQELQEHIQYQVEVPFETQERWRARIIVQSAGGSGEATVDVETTLPGLGHWDVLLYFFPFLAVGLLWLPVVLYRRKRNIVAPMDAKPGRRRQG
jgi:hypothetical protein